MRSSSLGNIFPVLAALIGACLVLEPVSAQTPPPCGEPYTVQESDTIRSLADRAYESEEKWSVIYYGNQESLPDNPDILPVGQQIIIPCLVPDPVPDTYIPKKGGEWQLLTGADYPPFTIDSNADSKGLLVDLVEKAFVVPGAEAKDAPTGEIKWVADWSSHFDSLRERKYEMGFPWFKPNCDDRESLQDDGLYRCDNFLFSDPLFDMLIFLFYRGDRPIDFETDAGVEGKILCRPAGYFTFDLNRPGRSWIAEKKISLVQPRNLDDCFKKLAAGEVDGVTINEFTGRDKIAELGLTDVVEAHPRPVSVLSLHTIVSRNHPRATVMLFYFNQRLRAFKETNEYQELLDQYLSAHWAKHS